jgi:hypothetical protein
MFFQGQCAVNDVTYVNKCVQSYFAFHGYNEVILHVK